VTDRDEGQQVRSAGVPDGEGGDVVVARGVGHRVGQGLDLDVEVAPGEACPGDPEAVQARIDVLVTALDQSVGDDLRDLPRGPGRRRARR